mmetsp:Transcript_28167/g.79026  ORF Transcript_28167/g.79026 Transcript_28167/m.79026 type:complete len:217 (+) Transcript_28167:1460-2110(+)
MAPLKFLFIAASATVASAFAPVQYTRQTTQLRESFGLGLGEDTYENQPDLLRGEQEYKQYMNKVKEDNMLNKKYNVIGRVRELELLEKTIDAGVLTKLEALGLDLETIEELLPVIEKTGLLSIAANNQQLLVNLVAPLLIEGAPFLLPVVSGALGVGPAAFYLAAAGCAGAEGLLVVNNVEVPFVGLPAAGLLGLLLVPLTVVLAGAGVALGSLKK